MRQLFSLASAMVLLACGHPQPPDSPTESETVVPAPSEEAAAAQDGSGDSPSSDNEFALRDSKTAGSARGATASKIKPTKTEAAMKFFVVDKKKEEPIPGIVISLTAPDGSRYYTEETDSEGYAEVLVPVGQKYELVYLSLGRRKITAKVPVPNEPNQNIKLTLRYKRLGGEAPPLRAAAGKSRAASDEGSRFVLKGVEFDTAKAKIRPESFPELEKVVEYMTHKKSARIRISGHTDNVGVPAANKDLSERRARSVRDYLISNGIDGDRIEAVGYGEERPIASNGTPEGRQKNRRIEATEL